MAAAMLCGALVPLALHGHPGGVAAAVHPPTATARSVQPRPAGTGTGPATTSRKIALVVWEGAQPPGYRVSEMPKGWVVQGSNPCTLVIAPAHDPSKSPDVFIGKLVVMLQSRDATSPPSEGARQPVNGRPGMFDVQGDTQILTFQIAGGDGSSSRPDVARLGQRGAGAVRQRCSGAGRRAARQGLIPTACSRRRGPGSQAPGPLRLPWRVKRGATRRSVQVG